LSDPDVHVDIEEEEREEEAAEEAQAQTAEVVEEKNGTWIPAPDFPSAKDALRDLKLLLKPQRLRGIGHKDPELNPFVRERMEAVRSFLVNYTQREGNGSNHHGQWSAASLACAKSYEKGPYHARKLREWARSFISDRSDLPINPYGTWSASVLDDEDVVADIHLHLTTIGKYMRALDIVHFTGTPKMLRRLDRKKPVSLTTAQRWLKRHEYRWTKNPSGQFVDGHERADVVHYRQTVFLLSILKLEGETRKWTDATMDEDVVEEPVLEGAKRKRVIWFHDESTFYANDRRQTRWVHKSETATPRAKGEGASQMVADFVSADYGWLQSPDSTETARVLFKAGKARSGYFTNDDVLEQTQKAMNILRKYYPNEDHVLIFDNATTHLKRSDEALSA